VGEYKWKWLRLWSGWNLDLGGRGTDDQPSERSIELGTKRIQQRHRKVRVGGGKKGVKTQGVEGIVGGCRCLKGREKKGGKAWDLGESFVEGRGVLGALKWKSRKKRQNAAPANCDGGTHIGGNWHRYLVVRKDHPDTNQKPSVTAEKKLPPHTKLKRGFHAGTW